MSDHDPISKARDQGMANVAWWGADASGVTESSDEIQKAIDDCAANKIGILFFGSGEFKIKKEIHLYSGLKIIGSGWGADSAGASDPDTPQTCWLAQTPGMTMLRIQSKSDGNVVWGAQVRDIYFKGNNRADRLVWMRSPNHCQFSIGGEKCRDVAFQIDDGNNAIAQNNHFDWLFYSSGEHKAAENGHGLALRETHGLGTTRTTANRVSLFTGKNGDGIIIGDHDAGQFVYVGAKPNDGGTGTGVRFGNMVAPFGQREVSRKKPDCVL